MWTKFALQIASLIGMFVYIYWARTSKNELLHAGVCVLLALSLFYASKLPKHVEITRNDHKPPSTRKYVYHAQVSPENDKWRLPKTISDFESTEEAE